MELGWLSVTDFVSGNDQWQEGSRGRSSERPHCDIYVWALLLLDGQSSRSEGGVVTLRG